MTYRQLKQKAKGQLKEGTNRRDLMLAYLLPSLIQAAVAIITYLMVFALIQKFGIDKALTDPDGFQNYLQSGNRTGSMNTILEYYLHWAGVRPFGSLKMVMKPISAFPRYRR